MKITVKLFATLRKGRFDVAEREYRQGTTVADVLTDLGIMEKVVIVFINNCYVSLEHDLKEGDTLAIFPPVGGG